ncbi:competence type IV pilus assembly protein ComGB [Streptococcus cuniculipharyngis]|uniref:competence type IV pilus assembly protein ComGB n=1 Tax=Streptococcus cuniculipharyngis TaxID=1562651 RepID=UPI002482FC88|nr:competence type IV pilus assembly protein ComGB [Streptococcus cuniculipharyngis]
MKHQRKVIQLFNNLLGSGFNLTEIVDFLDRSQLIGSSYTETMRQELMAGGNLATIMGRLGFSDSVVTQLALANEHGDLGISMGKIEVYLTKLLLVRKKLLEVATYPLILLTFLTLIMIGLKSYLLPQLENGQENIAAQLIASFPLIFLVSLVGAGLLAILIYAYSKRLTRIRLAELVSRLPFVGYFLRLYLTAYYAREWGNLIGQGIELVQLVNIMQAQQSKLFQEIGRELEASLLLGEEFHHKVLSYPFFLNELALMIEYGQVKSKLGRELTLYAEEVWERFFNKLAQATQFIQPLVFIMVALVVVMIYAAMLLPMYQNMEVNF